MESGFGFVIADPQSLYILRTSSWVRWGRFQLAADPLQEEQERSHDLHVVGGELVTVVRQQDGRSPGMSPSTPQ
jgi:hypothetical protein